MGFFLWIVVGGLSGWIAGKVIKGSGYGFFRNIIVGIVGACLGGWLGDTLGVSWAQVDGFNLASIGTAVIGAIAFLLILKLIFK